MDLEDIPSVPEQSERRAIHDAPKSVPSPPTGGLPIDDCVESVLPAEDPLPSSESESGDLGADATDEEETTDLAMSIDWAVALPPAIGDPGMAGAHRPELTQPLGLPADIAANEAELSDRLVIVGASVRGVAHRAEGTPREDSFDFVVSADGAWLVAAVADGVSSESASYKAAQIATRVGTALILNQLEQLSSSKPGATAEPAAPEAAHPSATLSGSVPERNNGETELPDPGDDSPRGRATGTGLAKRSALAIWRPFLSIQRERSQASGAIVSSVAKPAQPPQERCVSSSDSDQVLRSLDLSAVFHRVSEKIDGVSRRDHEPRAVSMATTALYCVVRTEPSEEGHIALLAWVGDTSGWLLERGEWGIQTELKNDGSGVKDERVYALPTHPDTSRMVRLVVPVGAALLLVTDGIGDPLEDDMDGFGGQLADWWSAPPQPQILALQVDFRRRSYVDDRTVVGIWTREGG